MKDVFIRVNQKLTQTKGKLQGNLLECYWYIGELNAGDLVTPFLLKKYGFTPLYKYPPLARMMGCGSILQRISPDYTGYIVGSGFLRDGDPMPLPKARVLAVRGEKTRDRIGAPIYTPLGDPGLLIAKYVKINSTPRYTLGIVPHYIDKQDRRILKLMRRYREEICFIDIQVSPVQVLKKIAQCQTILSSSLHGCVFADSLKIPVIWLDTPGTEQNRYYKYADYSSAFSRSLQPTNLSGDEPLSEILKHSRFLPPDEVEDVMGKLDMAFQKLRSDLLGNIR